MYACHFFNERITAHDEQHLLFRQQKIVVFRLGASRICYYALSQDENFVHVQHFESRTQMYNFHQFVMASFESYSINK
jgi:hypothetical protein